MPGLNLLRAAQRTVSCVRSTPADFAIVLPKLRAFFKKHFLFRQRAPSSETKSSFLYILTVLLQRKLHLLKVQKHWFENNLLLMKLCLLSLHSRSSGFDCQPIAQVSGENGFCYWIFLLNWIAHQMVVEFVQVFAVNKIASSPVSSLSCEYFFSVRAWLHEILIKLKQSILCTCSCHKIHFRVFWKTGRRFLFDTNLIALQKEQISWLMFAISGGYFRASCLYHSQSTNQSTMPTRNTIK